MNVLIKSAAIVGLAGLMAVGAMSNSEARSRGAAVGVGIAAGAIAGAAIANSNRGYYGGGYYDDDAYAYAPGPAYGYRNGYESYGYEAAPAYRAPNAGRYDQRQHQGAGGTGTSSY